MMSFFQLLFTKLRLSNPWRYKAPFLISVPYFMLWAGQFDWQEAGIAIGFSFMTILGIAGFGYWANDYSDREEDKKAGKPNALADKPVALVIGLLIFLLALAIIPWIVYFPVTPVTGALLGAEFLLFCLYSLPPFRFKERGLLGPITDALYAHVNPCLLAAITFHELAPESFANLWIYLICLGIFQFGLGVRNILLHQLQDFENDVQSGTKTFVTQAGQLIGWRILQFIFLPLEIAGLAAWLWIMSTEMDFFFGIYPIFVLYNWFRITLLWGQKVPTSLRKILYQFFDDFYIEWIPLTVVGYLIFRDWHFAGLAPIHLVLFRNAILNMAKDIHSRFIKKWD